jgi:hypothetical protein
MRPYWPWKEPHQHGIVYVMNDASEKVVAWKFVAELKQPGGDVLPRVCYVKVANKDAAVKALLKQRPDAHFRIDAGEPLTEAGLYEALQDSFLPDEGGALCPPLNT